MPSRVSASPFINSNSGQELLRCTLPPLPWASLEFEHKTNIQGCFNCQVSRDAKGVPKKIKSNCKDKKHKPIYCYRDTEKDIFNDKSGVTNQHIYLYVKVCKLKTGWVSSMLLYIIKVSTC